MTRLPPYADNKCACGAEISRWSTRCNSCRVKSIVEKAVVVEPQRIARPALAASVLAERVIEDMCEEAFEDAADHVVGEKELIAAFEAAIEEFNSKQTSSSWVPRTDEVFAIPAPSKAGDAQ